MCATGILTFSRKAELHLRALTFNAIDSSPMDLAPGNDDPFLLVVKFEVDGEQLEGRIQVNQNRITSSNIRADLLNGGSFPQHAGDLILPLTDAIEYDGRTIHRDQGIFLNQPGEGHLKGQALLIRTGEKS